VHATDGLEHVEETVEVDDRDAVELQPAGNQVAQRLHGQRGAVGPAGRAGVTVPVGPDGPGREGRVDLVPVTLELGRRVVRDGDLGVARDRDHERLIVRGRNVHDDDRVGPDAVLGVVTVALVHAEQQDVDRTVDVGAAQLLGDRHDLLDVAGQPPRRQARNDHETATDHHHGRAENDAQFRPEWVLAHRLRRFGIRPTPTRAGARGRRRIGVRRHSLSSLGCWCY
jgi:hypothetical protein